MGHIGMGKIFKSLEENRKLQEVNLSWNEIRADTDIKPLGPFIRYNANLIHLDLSKVLTSEEQVKYIIKQIKKAPSL
jgi:Ran GTPase-activating protein (RanGAP) involved in mRNA processing and transport